MDSSMLALGVGIGLGFAGLGCGIGQGLAANGGAQGVARQPEAQGAIRTTMLIGMAFVESILIFCWVILFLMYTKIGAAPAAAGATSSIEQPAHHQSVAMNYRQDH